LQYGAEFSTWQQSGDVSEVKFLEVAFFYSEIEGRPVRLKRSSSSGGAVYDHDPRARRGREVS
jgi:hypothetical protein